MLDVFYVKLESISKMYVVYDICVCILYTITYMNLYYMSNTVCLIGLDKGIGNTYIFSVLLSFAELYNWRHGHLIFPQEYVTSVRFKNFFFFSEFQPKFLHLNV